MIRYNVFNSFNCDPVDPDDPIYITVTATDTEDLRAKVRQIAGIDNPTLQVLDAAVVEEESPVK